jgi:hypothetical protein
MGCLYTEVMRASSTLIRYSLRSSLLEKEMRDVK